MKLAYKGNKKMISDVDEETFDMLKRVGILWVFYPDAPEFYEKGQDEES